MIFSLQLRITNIEEELLTMKNILCLYHLRVICLSILTLLIACENQSPLEKAGKSMDKKLEDAGEKIEDATDDASDKIEDAGDSLKKKTSQ